MRYIFLLILFIVHFSAFGQTKGGKTLSADTTSNSIDTLPVNFEKRFALIIGNEEYKDSPLRNPGNDADSMTILLRRYGFQTETGKDLSGPQILQLIKNFAQKVKKERGISLVYFSGHGLQYQAKNYLLPIQCTLTSLTDITLCGIDLQSILQQITYAEKGMNIVILDACRNSSYYEQWKELEKGPSYQTGGFPNTEIFFATSSGSVAEDGKWQNSPFTESLLEVITKNDSIGLGNIEKEVTRKVLQKTNRAQRPQNLGTLTEDFYFRKRARQERKIWLLAIGIDNYQDPQIPPLRYSADCVKLVDSAFRVVSNFRDNVISYALTNKEATYTAIKKNMDYIRSTAQDGDLIVFYFAGHATIEDSNTYLLPADVNLAQVSEKGISNRMLISLLADVPCQSILLLDGGRSASLEEEGFFKQLTQPENNVIVFCATKPNGVSMEGAQWNGSPFSYYLLQGMEKANILGDGMIRLRSYFDYVVYKVRDATGGKQTPAYYLPGSTRNIIMNVLGEKRLLASEVENTIKATMMR